MGPCEHRAPKINPSSGVLTQLPSAHAARGALIITLAAAAAAWRPHMRGFRELPQCKASSWESRCKIKHHHHQHIMERGTFGRQLRCACGSPPAPAVNLWNTPPVEDRNHSEPTSQCCHCSFSLPTSGHPQQPHIPLLRFIVHLFGRLKERMPIALTQALGFPAMAVEGFLLAGRGSEGRKRKKIFKKREPALPAKEHSFHCLRLYLKVLWYEVM